MSNLESWVRAEKSSLSGCETRTSRPSIESISKASSLPTQSSILSATNPVPCTADARADAVPMAIRSAPKAASVLVVLQVDRQIGRLRGAMLEGAFLEARGAQRVRLGVFREAITFLGDADEVLLHLAGQLGVVKKRDGVGAGGNVLEFANRSVVVADLTCGVAKNLLAVAGEALDVIV